MSRLAELIKEIYAKTKELRLDPEREDCLTCDCYILLHYYITEEFPKEEKEGNEAMLDDARSTFDGRKEIGMHGCLGCEPCPPAGWTTDIIKGAKLD